MTVLASIYKYPRVTKVSTPYDPAIIAQFKAMPGCFYDHTDKTWCGPDEAVVEVVKILETADIVIPMVSDHRPRPAPLVIVDDSITKGLYDYQKEGVNFIVNKLIESGGALLADDMGLGKTAQALRAVEQFNKDCWKTKILIVCPGNVVLQWIKQAKKWIGADVVRLGKKLPKKQGGGKVTNWDRGLAVVSWDQLRTLKKDLPTDIDFFVLDELHYAASSKSARSKAICELMDNCRKTRQVVSLGLTGTPIDSRPKDLWHPLNLLWPGRFGSFFKFGVRYCDGQTKEIKGVDEPKWDFNGRSNLAELGRRLRDGGLMLRRVKGEVLELPPTQRINLPVELPEAAAKRLRRAAQLAAAAPNENVGRILSQIEEHKISAAIELAENVVAGGGRPLLLTIRRDTARQLGESLNAPVVTGEDHKDHRLEKLTGAKIGVATIDSVSTGLDGLQDTFDTVIFVGLDWVPSTLLQAESRLYRIGQLKKVTFYYLIGMGTLDEAICAKVIERLDDFATIVGNAPDEQKLAQTLRGDKTEQQLLDELFASLGED